MEFGNIGSWKKYYIDIYINEMMRCRKGKEIRRKEEEEHFFKYSRKIKREEAAAMEDY